MKEFLRKYRWWIVGVLVVYVGISLLLVLLTDSPQSLPFQYQVR